MDLIGRQAAIDALDEPCKVTESWTDEYAVGERAQYEKDVKALNSLPSAERRGRWLDGKCSVCEADAPYTDDGFWEETAYCPNCGARMEAE